MASRKGINIYIPKYFMAVRNCMHFFVLLEVLSMVWSNGMNPSSILQQFNWSHQLIIVCFFLHFWGFRFLYDLEAIPTKSVGQETVFVGRDYIGEMDSRFWNAYCLID